MTSVFAFLIVLLQSILVGVAYSFAPENEQWREFLTLILVHFSPVMVFFSALNTGIGFYGEFSYWMWFGLVYCLIKYMVLWRGMVNDGVTTLTALTLFMEIAYIAGGTYMIVNYSYL